MTNDIIRLSLSRSGRLDDGGFVGIALVFEIELAIKALSELVYRILLELGVFPDLSVGSMLMRGAYFVSLMIFMMRCAAEPARQDGLLRESADYARDESVYWSLMA